MSNKTRYSEYILTLERRATDARWLLHVALDVLNRLEDYKDPNKAKESAIRTIEIAMKELKGAKQ